MTLKLPVQQVTHTLYTVTNNTRSKGVFQGRSGTSKTGWNPHVHWTGRKVCLEPVAGSRRTRGLTLPKDTRNCCIQWQGNDNDSPWLYLGGRRRGCGRTRRPGTGRDTDSNTTLSCTHCVSGMGRNGHFQKEALRKQNSSRNLECLKLPEIRGNTALLFSFHVLYNEDPMLSISDT